MKINQGKYVERLLQLVPQKKNKNFQNSLMLKDSIDHLLAETKEKQKTMLPVVYSITMKNNIKFIPTRLQNSSVFP